MTYTSCYAKCFDCDSETMESVFLGAVQFEAQNHCDDPERHVEVLHLIEAALLKTRFP